MPLNSSSDLSLENPEEHRNTLGRVRIAVASALAGLLPLIAFWSTCYPTITWWDSAEYATAAICLGNPHPPGSLLLTLIGWLFTELPLGISDILSLNLLAGLMAAVTGGMVVVISIRLLEITYLSRFEERVSAYTWATLAGAVLGSLAFTLGETAWLYAVKFTPYILTVLFTSLLLWAALGWWRNADRAEAFRWLFLIGLLIGLDFSVHRTNAVLLPGLFLWILILKPATLASIRSWLTGAVGLLIGLSLHLLIIPIAARHPFINGGNPETWTRFWDYVSLRQLGGSFLVKFFPRKGDFWSDQVGDFFEAFAANFFTTDGLWIIGWLPLLLGLLGLVLLWQRRRRLAIAYLTLFLMTIVVTVVYFNIPADFFRSLHRHYLPCLLLFSVLIVYGAGSLAAMAWRSSGGKQPVATALAAILLLAVPVSQAARNYRAVDGSRNYFAYDFAQSMFAGLEPNAILFVCGDNDTFPLWFLQVTEKARPDITVLNTSLLNTPWYVKDQLERDSKLPLSLTAEQIDQLTPIAWKDTVIAVATPSDTEGFGLPDDVEVPDFIRLEVGPSFSEYLLVSDQLVLRLFLKNEWRRPFYVATTAGPSQLPWLQPYLRFEGLAMRAVPLESPPLNLEILSDNLLERFSYRGWSDPLVEIEDVSRMMALNSASGFLQLTQAQLSAGDTAAAAATLEAFEERLPIDRLQPPEPLRQAVEQMKAASAN